MFPTDGLPFILGRYRLLGKLLGKGHYAKVEEAMHLDLVNENVHVAIKMIDTHTVRDPYVLRHLHREAKVLLQLKHPNIIAIFEVLKAGSHYCIVTEHVGGGELSAHVGRQPRGHLDELTTLLFGAQLISALAHMHSLNVVHRDLKMANIMLTRRGDQVKIVDFGLGRTWTATRPLRTHCGSPGYAAPEIYQRDRPYGPQVDLWSLGVVLYYMAVGRMPFPPCTDKDRSPEERRKRLLAVLSRGATEKHVKLMSHFSPEFRDLVQGLLTPSVSRRLSLQQTVVHPWVSNRLRARQMLNIPYKLSSQERALILSKVSLIMKSTVQSIEAQLRQDNLGEVAAMYNILAHKQLSKYHASWTQRPASPKRLPAAAMSGPSGGPSYNPYTKAQPRHHGPQEQTDETTTRQLQRPAGASGSTTSLSQSEEVVFSEAEGRVDQPDSSSTASITSMSTVRSGSSDDMPPTSRAKEAARLPQPPALRHTPRLLALRHTPRPPALRHAPRPLALPHAHNRDQASDGEQDGEEVDRYNTEDTHRDGDEVAAAVAFRGEARKDAELEVGEEASNGAEVEAEQDPVVGIGVEATVRGATATRDEAMTAEIKMATKAEVGVEARSEVRRMFDVGCLLTDADGKQQFEPLPETKLMFYTSTILDNVHEALFTPKSDSKGATTTAVPIKSALASQTGLASKTRKAVSFSIIATTHSTDSGGLEAETPAILEEQHQDAGVQANLGNLFRSTLPLTLDSDKEVTSKNSQTMSGRVEELASSDASKSIHKGEMESPNHAQSTTTQLNKECSETNQEVNLAVLQEDSAQIFVSSKQNIQKDNMSTAEKLFKTVPVLRKVSPEPKKNIYETRRWPLRSPRAIYQRMKGHPKLSVSYLLDSEENLINISLKNVLSRSPNTSVTTAHSTILPAHKEDSEENESSTFDPAACPTHNEDQAETNINKNQAIFTGLLKGADKTDTTKDGNLIEKLRSIKGDKSHAKDRIEQISSEQDMKKNSTDESAKRPLETVAELVRTKIGTMKEKQTDSQQMQEARNKPPPKKKRSKFQRYQRFFPNRFRVDLALVMTLERSRKIILPSIHSPWRSLNPENSCKSHKK